MKINVGDVFSNLTVIEEYTGEKKDSTGKRFWTCKCKCKNITHVREDNLLSGNTKSCGCMKPIPSPKLVEAARKTGLANRKHFGCTICGSDKHYAKGYCRNCYEKERRKQKNNE